MSFLEGGPLAGLGTALQWPEKKLGFNLYARWIPEKPDHGKWYLNLSYQVTDWLRVGADYRPLRDDVSLLANQLLVQVAGMLEGDGAAECTLLVGVLCVE